MEYYNVSYYVGDDIWSSNITLAASEKMVHEYYSKKSDRVLVSKAEDWEVETAKRKGMPILTIV